MRDLRNLPAAVLDRLADSFGAETLTEPLAGFDTVVVDRGVQKRVEERARPVELRQTDDGDPVLEGYATVWNTWYDVFGGPPIGWREMVAEGAATKSIAERDDVRLLVNHTGIPLARTESKTLVLSSDKVGLHVVTPDGIDMRSPDVQTLVVAMQRGDIDQMSFAFRATRSEWNDDFTERIIREVQLFDVSVVTFPANPVTVAQLRAVDGPTEPAQPRMSLDLARAIAESLRV